jgi:Uma2 family endonuclease
MGCGKRMCYHARTNAPVRHPITAPTKYRLTVDDVFAMQDAGILPPHQSCELIHGELIERPSEGDLHSYVKARLIWWFNRHLDPEAYWVGPDTTFFLDREEAPEPDLFITAAGVRPSQARGDTVLLVVEVAASSLSFDKSVKADLYRDYGVREYWVVDAEARRTLVHRLSKGKWGAVTETPFEEALVPALIPGVAVRIADWG